MKIKFIRKITSLKTRNLDVPAPQFRDQQFNVSMMFNTDFELFFNLTLDESGKAQCKLETTCGFDDSCGVDGVCPKSGTYDIALHYARVINETSPDV